ncbi:Alpha/Beta hydrolase protein [Thelephora terrestris]|uniref:Alpha/Beta hydrolase protein n=1 Tax=Thelephora terrestris TaxID=56493 RepID=A0A9P6H467_9AGAM|nr:Alpha/Beta hydrolase protein [Thelephora terrestris]
MGVSIDEKLVVPSPQKRPGLLSISERLRHVLTAAGIVYILAILSLFTPPVQRNAIFMHNLKLPWGANFSRPEEFGLSPLKTVNLVLTSTDNVTLGSWFTFSEPFYRSRIRSRALNVSEAESCIPEALRAYPTVLYLHGNAATRVVPTRVQIYSTFSSRVQVNVLAIDYRGFAESAGYPTEHGVIDDALSAIKWLVQKGAKLEDILIVGHSLGAGIATQSVERAEREFGQSFRGLVIMGGQASVPHQMETFVPRGIPVLRPVKLIPGGWNLLLAYTYTQLRTLDHISNVKSPVTIVHSHDDDNTPISHAVLIFDQLVSSVLGPAPPSFHTLPLSTSEEEFTALKIKHQEYRKLRDDAVTISRVADGAFVVNEVVRSDGVKLAFLETKYGGHGRIAAQEGVQDILADRYNLVKPL